MGWFCKYFWSAWIILIFFYGALDILLIILKSVSNQKDNAEREMLGSHMESSHLVAKKRKFLDAFFSLLCIICWWKTHGKRTEAFFQYELEKKHTKNFKFGTYWKLNTDPSPRSEVDHSPKKVDQFWPIGIAVKKIQSNIVINCILCLLYFFQSFENHVKGRPHEWMLTKLDESNKLVVDLLRHQVRVSQRLWFFFFNLLDLASFIIYSISYFIKSQFW